MLFGVKWPFLKSFLTNHHQTVNSIPDKVSMIFKLKKIIVLLEVFSVHTNYSLARFGHYNIGSRFLTLFSFFYTDFIAWFGSVVVILRFSLQRWRIVDRLVIVVVVVGIGRSPFRHRPLKLFFLTKQFASIKRERNFLFYDSLEN